MLRPRWTMRYDRRKDHPVVWNCPPFWADRDEVELVPLDEVEDFLRFAWDAYVRDVGHPPGWDWRDRADVLRNAGK